eukprot:TRINITY_DN6227_c0_g1_i1.p1 TRINITY_DN6227_c0_g1~~TRINITY_DN6227_c0_g1_i1.p1  ORF type:complete len:358 (-),score=58.14 TRINITY_DN6227_c0_g1_i1:90-1163(-)
MYALRFLLLALLSVGPFELEATRHNKEEQIFGEPTVQSTSGIDNNDAENEEESGLPWNVDGRTQQPEDDDDDDADDTDSGHNCSATPSSRPFPAETFAEAWVCKSPAEQVKTAVAEAAKQAIEARGYFSIAIAGGSLVKMLGAMKDMPEVEWDKWHVAWVDERCVPHNDDESNYKGARDAWLSHVPIPQSQIYTINEALCPGGGGLDTASEAAKDYEKQLRAVSEERLPRGARDLPAFDLLLLGFGPDGHICSLFPGHPLLSDNSGRWILPIGDSPKFPPERITFSLPVVNAAKQVMLVGTGEAKADVVRQVFNPPCELPCAKAHGAGPNKPIWILDEPAAAGLPAESELFDLKHFD